MEASDHFERELLRLRDRVHKIEGTLRAVELFKSELRGIAHDVGVLEGELRDLAAVVSNLAKADEIADAVALRIGERRQDQFTHWQLWGLRAAIFGSLLGGIDLLWRLAGG